MLDFRRLRVDVERASLDRLHADRQQLLAREHTLNALRADEESAVRQPGTQLTVTRLDALDHLQHYVTAARQRFAVEHSKLEQRIAQQQTAVMEAERKVGLLEKLEARQQADWKVLFNKELDELAADSYISRFHRQSIRGERLSRPDLGTWPGDPANW